MHPLDRMHRDHGLDMSVIPTEKRPMDSSHRMIVRNTFIVATGLVVLVVGILLCVSLLTSLNRDYRVTNNVTQRDEYTAAIKACSHAMPSNVTLCVANVNENFVTGG